MNPPPETRRPQRPTPPRRVFSMRDVLPLLLFGVAALLACALLAAWGALVWWPQTPAANGPPGQTTQIPLLSLTPGEQTPPEPDLPLPALPTAGSTSSAGSGALPTVPPVALPSPLPASTLDVEALLAGMSLEQKIGQMLMAGVPGDAFGVQAERLISEYHVGAVVYFANNIDNPAQVLAYSQDLQRAAQAQGGIPLLIAIDHEGGTVYRFKDQLTHFPNAMTLGAANDSALTFQVAAANALELRAVGINTSLAPVLDVNSQPLNPVIGVRALAGFSDRVSAIGAAYIQGLQAGGVIATAKHFPGHGATLEDSHDQLARVDKSLEQLRLEDLPPFQQAITEGVGMILVGHIALPQIDPSGRPATLSPVIVTDLLRSEMGYEGVVMTDAMSMGAITKQYPAGEAAVLAAQAGCDLLAYTDAANTITAYQALLAAARSGELSQAQIDGAVRRILRLKAAYGLFDVIPPGDPALAMQLTAHAALARQLAQQAVTFTGPAQAPLLRAGRVVLVTPAVLSEGAVAGDGLSYLGDLLAAQGLAVDEWIYSPDNDGQISALHSDLLAALPDDAQVVFVSWDALEAQARGSPAQNNLLQALLDSGNPLLLVAGASPYDLALAAERVPALALYGGLPVQLEALAATLTATSLPTGLLAVAP